MRIAVYHNLPSGGAKRSLYETLKRLSRSNNVDVYALTSADETFCDLHPIVQRHRSYPFAPCRLFTSPFGRLNQLQRWRDLIHLDRIAQQVAFEIDMQGYDVVFAQPCRWTQAPLLLRYLHTPAVYYCQEPPRAIYEFEPVSKHVRMGLRTALDRIDPLISLYRSTARRLDWEATRLAQAVLVNSKFMCDAVSHIYNISPHICYLGVDTTSFRPLPNLERQQYVLSVGAINPTKGFDFLIQSIGRLPWTMRPTLRLVGNVENEDERHRLEHLAQGYVVDLSIEIGIDQETLVRRYNQAALLAYAPYNEPFGLVPLEAMACGTPVVGVDEGGVRETVVDGLTGQLVRRNTQEFAAAIEGLLSDQGIRNTLGKQALAYVQEHWNWDKAATTVEQHLTAVAR